MTKTTGRRSRFWDPDPFVLDLIVKVAAAAATGVIIEAGKAIWNALPKQRLDLNPDELAAFGQRLNVLGNNLMVYLPQIPLEEVSL